MYCDTDTLKSAKTAGKIFLALVDLGIHELRHSVVVCDSRHGLPYAIIAQGRL